MSARVARRRHRVVASLLLALGPLASSALAHADDVASACADAANAGQPLRRAGHLRAARAELLHCSSNACPDTIRSRCATWLAEVDGVMPSLVVRARAGTGTDVLGLKVWIDGDAVTSPPGVATTIDPGPHHLRAETPDGATREEDVVVAQGEKSRVVLFVFAPAAASSRPLSPFATAPRPLVSPAVAYGIGAVGVLALGAFAVFEVKAHQGYSDLENGCSRTQSCAPSALDDVRRDGAVAVVAGGVGVAAVAASVFLLLWRSEAAH